VRLGGSSVRSMHIALGPGLTGNGEFGQGDDQVAGASAGEARR
jgi:hypothetical protein